MNERILHFRELQTPVRPIYIHLFQNQKARRLYMLSLQILSEFFVDRYY